MHLIKELYQWNASFDRFRGISVHRSPVQADSASWVVGYFRFHCCAPSYSVDSCLQRSNGVWWVEVLSYHVFLSSPGMYCPTISSVIKLDLGSFDRSYAMASIKHVS